MANGTTILHAMMDIYGLFWGVYGLKYVFLPFISPLGNKKTTSYKEYFLQVKGYIQYSILDTRTCTCRPGRYIHACEACSMYVCMYVMYGMQLYTNCIPVYEYMYVCSTYMYIHVPLVCTVNRTCTFMYSIQVQHYCTSTTYNWSHFCPHPASIVHHQCNGFVHLLNTFS